MNFTEKILNQTRPGSIFNVELPRTGLYFTSPADWRNEVLYFILPDRFSDGLENSRTILDRTNLESARPAIKGQPWRWDHWAESGAQRWQGGTLRGIQSKLSYLKNLGISTLWLGPIFKQRGHIDSYHGYAIEDFLDVDQHFGNRKDLVDLVADAHKQGIRIILDIIFNHSGMNWVYGANAGANFFQPPYTAGRYEFGAWLRHNGEQLAGNPVQPDDGVWPKELQDTECYTRAGSGNLGAGDIQDPDAEHKRSDFLTLRDFNLARSLNILSQCYKYWIALTDCDGFRIDTLKHVSFEDGRNFCGAIKEFAAKLGKTNFFLVGEIAGGDANQDRYLDALDRNLDAALDIGDLRLTLRSVAKGLSPGLAFFNAFDANDRGMGSHRNLGLRHVSILDDHDHVFGEKIRFSSEASTEQQVAGAVAIQLFSLGIPCIYYGTEQALSGPERDKRQWLAGWNGGDFADRYLRETMFGAIHPCKSGVSGMVNDEGRFDTNRPGFGPFGTAGVHCFDENFHVYRCIAAMTAMRRKLSVLRFGRQYLRQIRFLGRPFGFWGPGEIVAWSRILDDEESLIVFNSHGTENRGADIIVDQHLSVPGETMTVVLNSLQSALGTFENFDGPYPINSTVTIEKNPSGGSFVSIQDLHPSEVIILCNYLLPQEE